MTRSVQSKMARGAVWMMLFKLVERSLGLVSTLILVRLLAPADFGIMAMAFSFILVAELLTAFGFDIALIQRQDATEEHYHSAWTCNVLLGLTITVLMLATAWPIALFYGQPDVFWVVCALAIGPLIGGAENIGVVAFRKDLDFRKEFAFQLSRKVAGFVCAVPLAFWLQSYWALVGGTLAFKLAGTVNSYWVHPFRPHFSLRQARALIGFSKWLLLNNIVGFLKERTSDFFIGRLHGPAALGLYNVSYEFANLPSTEMSAPINRALLPGFARLTSERAALAGAYLNAMRVLALFAIPAAAGVFAVAEYFVPVVLGAKWLETTPLLKLLTINGALLFFHSSICAVLIGTGHPDRAVKTNSIYVVLMIAGFILLADIGTLGVVYTVLTASVLTTPVYLYQVRRCIGVKAISFLGAALRPMIASLIMILAVHGFLPDFSATQSTLESISWLGGGVVVGVITYISAMVVMWLVLSRPAGAESMLIEKIHGRIRARWSYGSSG